jgi:flagellar hook-associated protein FlgK
MMNAFFGEMSGIAALPGDMAPRAAGLAQGSTLAASFNNTSNVLQDLANAAYGELQSKVEEVNLLTAALGAVNGRLRSSNLGGTPPNMLLDERDRLIDEISERMNVTVAIGDRYEAEVFIGSSEMGPTLVAGERVTPLTALMTSEKAVKFKLGTNTFISNIQGGAINGLNDAFMATQSAVSDLDALARKITTDMNHQHQQGIDLEGELGGAMFTSADFEINAGVQNRGNTTATLNKIPGQVDVYDYIEFGYNAASNMWTGRDADGVILGSGRTQVQLEGGMVEFSGKPKDGDSQQMLRVSGDASRMSFLLTRAEQFAAASTLKVTVNAGNEGTGAISTSIASIPSSGLSSIETVLKNHLSPVAATDFIRDGVVAVIPANVSDIEFASLNNQPTMRVSTSDISTLQNVSFQLDGTTYSFDVDPTLVGEAVWEHGAEIANSLNDGIIKASVNLGSSTNTVTSGTGSNSGILTPLGANSSILNTSIEGIPITAAITQGSTPQAKKLHAAALANAINDNTTLRDRGITAQVLGDVNVQVMGSSGVSLSALGVFASGFEGGVVLASGGIDTDGNAKAFSNATYRLAGGGAQVAETKPAQVASDIQIFTREGRQIAGDPLTDGQAATLLTPLNGFVSGAEYRADYLTANDGIGYRGMSVDTFQADGLKRLDLSVSGLGSDGTNAELISQARTGSPNLTPPNNINKQTITVVAENGAERNVTIPSGVAADYVAEKLSAELSPLGINVSSHTRVFLEMPTGVETGTIGFDIAGSNIVPVSVATSISKGDLTGLAEAINYRSSVTGIFATLTNDSKRIALDQPDGADIFISNILADSIHMDVSVLDGDFLPFEDIPFDFSQGLAFSGTTQPIAEVAAEVKIAGTSYISAVITSVESSTTNPDDGYTVAFDTDNNKVTVLGAPTGPGSLVIDLDDGNSIISASVIVVGNETRDELAAKIDTAVIAANPNLTTTRLAGSDYIAANSGPIKKVVDDVTGISLGSQSNAHVMTITATSGSLDASIEGIDITVAADSSLQAGATSFANAVNTNESLLAMGIKAVASGDSNGQVSLYYKNTKSLWQNTRVSGQLSMTSKSGFNLQSSEKPETNSFAKADPNLGGLVTRNFTKAGTAASLQFAANVEIDGAATNVDGTKAQAPSAFYDGKLDAIGGAFEANVSSGEIGETSSALIDREIAGKMRSQAPVPSITGVPIASLPPVGSFARFSIGEAEYTLERDTNGLKVSGPEAGRVFINTEDVYGGGFSTNGEPVLLGQSITLLVNGGSLTGSGPVPLFDDNASLFGFGAGANFSSGSDKFSPLDPKVTYKAQSVLQGRDFTVPENGKPTVFTAAVNNEAVVVTLTNNFNPIGVVIGGVTFASGVITSVESSTGVSDDGYTVAFDAKDNKVTVAGAPTGAGTLAIALTNASGHIVKANVTVVGTETQDQFAAVIDTAIDTATAAVAGMSKTDNGLGAITLTPASGIANFIDISSISALTNANISLSSNVINVNSAPTVAGTISFDLLDSAGNSLAISVPVVGNESAAVVATAISAAIDTAISAATGNLTTTTTLATGVSIGTGETYNELTVSSATGSSTDFNISFMGGTVSGTYLDASGSPASADELDARASQLANVINANVNISKNGGTAIASTNGTGTVVIEGALSVTTDEKIAVANLDPNVLTNILTQQARVTIGEVSFVSAATTSLETSTSLADDGYEVLFDAEKSELTVIGKPSGAGTFSIALTESNGHVINAHVNVSGSETQKDFATAIDAAIDNATAAVSGLVAGLSVSTATVAPISNQAPVTGGADLVLTAAAADLDSGAGRQVTITSTGDDSTNSFLITGTDVGGVSFSELVNGKNDGTATSVGFFASVTQISPTNDPDDLVSASFTVTSDANTNATVTLSGGQNFTDISSINGPGGGTISLSSNVITVTNTPTLSGNITFDLIDTNGNKLAISAPVGVNEAKITVANRIKIAIEDARSAASDGLTTKTELITDRITLVPSGVADATTTIQGVTVTANDIEQTRYTFGADGLVTTTLADLDTQKNNYANRFAQVINENAELAALGLSAVPTVDGTGDVFVKRLSVSLTPANNSTAVQLRADLVNGPILVTGGASATDLGFKVAESDLLVTEDGLTVTSLNGLPVDLSGSGTSLAETRMKLTDLPTEELIVVVAGGGSRRISAKYTIDSDITVDPLKKEQQYQVRMLDAISGRVELIDKETGHSIATRISNGNAQFDADGLRFNLNGYAATGDSFDVLTGQKAAGDARNMDEIMVLATSTVSRSSFQDDFRSIAASVGSTLESSRLSKLSAEAVRDAAVAAEDEVSGVNMDEEAAKLITQQQAYQAAARILQTAKEMFDTLMQIR